MKLIAQFGTIEELLAQVDAVTPERIKALPSNRQTMHGSAASSRPSKSIVPWNSIRRASTSTRPTRSDS